MKPSTTTVNSEERPAPKFAYFMAILSPIRTSTNLSRTMSHHAEGPPHLPQLILVHTITMSPRGPTPLEKLVVNAAPRPLSLAASVYAVTTAPGDMDNCNSLRPANRGFHTKHPSGPRCMALAPTHIIPEIISRRETTVGGTEALTQLFHHT